MTFESYQLRMDPVQVEAGADPQNPLRVIERTSYPVEGQEDFDPHKLLNCQGPEDKYVILISSENQEYFIKREHALQSSTLRTMLEDPRYPPSDSVEQVRFPFVRSHILLYVCQYLVFRATYSGAQTWIPPFPFKREIAFELLEIADFLDI